MSLVILGKIIMQDPKCVQCDNEIRLYSQTDDIKCTNCGSLYRFQTKELTGEYMEYQYEFVEFNCIHNNFIDKCTNACPAPFMFCEYHVSDQFISDAKKAIKSCESRLQDSKDKLDKIHESKKSWIIRKLSGLDESRETEDSE